MRTPGRTTARAPSQGGQHLALFNAHYDTRCFQPIVIFEAIRKCSKHPTLATGALDP
jgi:hypothetical protein